MNSWLNQFRREGKGKGLVPDWVTPCFESVESWVCRGAAHFMAAKKQREEKTELQFPRCAQMPSDLASPRPSLLQLLPLPHGTSYFGQVLTHVPSGIFKIQTIIKCHENLLFTSLPVKNMQPTLNHYGAGWRQEGKCSCLSMSEEVSVWQLPQRDEERGHICSQESYPREEARIPLLLLITLPYMVLKMY